MGLQKTFLGYHSADGGKIYRETKDNSLFSNVYCSLCQSSSILGNLSIEQDLVSDITTLAEAFGGDAPNTDSEYVSSMGEMTEAWNATWGSLGGTFRPFSNINPFQNAFILADVVRYVGNAMNKAMEDKDFDMIAQGQAFRKIDDSTEVDGTMSAVLALDGTNTTYGYYFDPRPEWAKLIDTTVNMDYTYSTPQAYHLLQVTDTELAARVVSNTFTVPTPFNRVHLLICWPRDWYGDHYEDWTRGTTAQIRVSSDGGSNFESSKWVVPYPDGTQLSDTEGYSSAKVTVPLGTKFVWQLDFPGGTSDKKHAFAFFSASLYYQADGDDYFTEYESARYV